MLLITQSIITRLPICKKYIKSELCTSYLHVYTNACYVMAYINFIQIKGV